jgi:hypothetical protein
MYFLHKGVSFLSQDLQLGYLVSFLHSIHHCCVRADHKQAVASRSSRR